MTPSEIVKGLSGATAKALVRGDWMREQGDELARAGLIEHVAKHGFRYCNSLGLAVRAILEQENSRD